MVACIDVNIENGKRILDGNLRGNERKDDPNQALLATLTDDQKSAVDNLIKKVGHNILYSICV